MNALLWLAPVILPLVAALGALRWRPAMTWGLVLAPVPGLLLGLLGPPGPPPELSWLLLETTLDLGLGARPLLVMTALVWMVAGASARPVGSERPAFAALMLLTCAGNLGLLLAGDAVTFYVMFAWMTFAAYGLVVHERTASARRAGRVYVVLAVLGEVALLAGLVLAASHAGTTQLTDLAASLPTAPARSVVLGLLIAGFGVKMGLVPLHVWLPLAHPAAPIAASAVLSGTMIKAGLVGWLRTLPLGELALPGWGATLIGLGLLGALLGVVAGVTQSDAKVVLAYSSVSQMGLITTAVGLGLLLPGRATAAILTAVTYAVHHGVAKASLFLAVGVHKAGADGSRHRVLLAGMTVAAASLAGAPFTSGWIAKQAVKDLLAGLPADLAGALTLALSLAAAGTTVLMLRLLWLVRRPAGAASTTPGLLAPWAIITVAVPLGSWLLPATIPGAPTVLPASASGIRDGLWPLALGLALSAAWLRYRPDRHLGPAGTPPGVAPGDLLVLAERTAPPIRARAHRTMARLQALERRARSFQDLGRVTVRPGVGVDRLEQLLTSWRIAGMLYLLIGLAIGLTLFAGVR
jgi:formate hydrogenlyase subunit 3/multisubunit Na+/H+ antiporter MnhD subunit